VSQVRILYSSPKPPDKILPLIFERIKVPGGRDWGTATESFDKAIQINRQYQLPWDEARTLYEQGLMYLARGGKGDRDKAHEDLDEALAVFQKVGAKKDAEKVLRKKEMLKA
jgi:tetratricopeptide (TPR) repeat protein